MTPLYSSIALFSGTILFLLYGELPAHQVDFSFKAPYIAPHIERKSFYESPPKTVSFSTSPQAVSIADLLKNNQGYHQQLVSLRGLITQPELHLDKSELYLDFVFRLVQGTHSIIVYGRHDRTLGSPAIRMNQSVEVVGLFFKEQERKGSTIFNVLEAISVKPYPSSIPEST